MKKETAEQAKYIIAKIDTTEYQLKELDKHSFGFGTSYWDIDNVLRPVAKIYLQTKKDVLMNQLDNLN